MSRPKMVVAANTVRSIVAKYKKGIGFDELSNDFDISIPVIRRTLVENGVKIRGKGRPTLVA